MNIEFLETVYLRGLEGIVGDRLLEASIKKEGSPSINALEDYFEAKYMAIQIFFKMKGWGR